MFDVFYRAITAEHTRIAFFLLPAARCRHLFTEQKACLYNSEMYIILTYTLLFNLLPLTFVPFQVFNFNCSHFTHFNKNWKNGGVLKLLTGSVYLFIYIYIYICIYTVYVYKYII